MLFQGSYFECLKCVGIATNATTADFVQAQSLVDGLTVACSKEGFTLPELTFPGQNPNRTLATVSASQTSVQTTSQITISTLPPPGSSSPTGSPTIGTISQKTVSELPTTAAQAASSTGTPAPTTSPNAAYRQVSLDTRMLGFIVAGWMVL
ncbi:hypothetical protein B0H15DRAFT_306794 [Mycena belliarum]|uniref:Uncharacterized protein n=1 Tax=Mycena belliarum TaxID=1033014 RepID=A0AAD6U1U9_9AGAR|nr:hypothetical protein B0H15DRAFT_306794 [Mycena belliae]